MFEVLNFRKEDNKNSDVLEHLELEEGKCFVVSAHREENISYTDYVNKAVQGGVRWEI